MLSRSTACLLFAWLSLTAFTWADEPAAKPSYQLRYQFKAGDVLRWDVRHQVKIMTTVAGTTQNAATDSRSVKKWEVESVTDDGKITFVHSVESVVMTHRLSGREEQTFDSVNDKTPPPGFEDAAENIGVPLATVTMDSRGEVIERKDGRPRSNGYDGPMTIPLPEEAVYAGYEWKIPHLISIPMRDRTIKKVKTQQRYLVESIKDGIATIRVETQILTPINDPVIEAQLVQRETRGTVRFDINRGRVIEQNSEMEKRVIGHIGETSSMHYSMQFEEKLRDGEPQTVQGPQPAAPKLK